MDQFELNMDQDVIEEKISSAISNLLSLDKILIINDVNERSITHMLAIYIKAQFPSWDVDCEYNRDGIESKKIYLKPEIIQSDDEETRSVYPDIIVHHRNTDENLLVIEMKKPSNSKGSFDFDRIKLEKYKSDLLYQFAILIILGKNKNDQIESKLVFI